jgi:hypothetical protein
VVLAGGGGVGVGVGVGVGGGGGFAGCEGTVVTTSSGARTLGGGGAPEALGVLEALGALAGARGSSTRGRLMRRSATEHFVGLRRLACGWRRPWAARLRLTVAQRMGLVDRR